MVLPFPPNTPVPPPGPNPLAQAAGFAPPMPGPMGGPPMPPSPGPMPVPGMNLEGIPPAAPASPTNGPGGPQNDPDRDERSESGFPLVPGFDGDPEDLVRELIKEWIEKSAEDDHKPIYPAFYRDEDYPKPEIGETLTKVDDDHSRYGSLRTRIAKDLDAINGDVHGVFRTYDKYSDSIYEDTTLSGEYTLMKTMLGSLDVYFDAEAVNDDDKDEAEAKETAAYFWLREAMKAHAEQGNADWAMDLADSMLSTGRICWRCIINNDAKSDESPFVEHLLDPATVYPTFNARYGLETVTRWYTLTIGEVISTFADGRKQELKTKLLKDGTSEARKLTDKIDVKEYWDRRWYAVIVDGEFVYGPKEHGYGYPPFVYQVVPFGRSAFLKSPYGHNEKSTGMVGDVSYSESEEVAHQGYSFVHFLQKTHFQREAVLGAFYSEIEKSRNPAMNIYQDDLARAEGAPKLSGAWGARNKLMLNREKAEPFPTIPVPAVSSPILGVSGDAYARWVMPQEAHGIFSNAQQSGSAAESLVDSGREKMSPWLKAMTMFHIRRIEMQLDMFRNFGWHLGTDGKRGTFLVPRDRMQSNPGGYVKLTHGMLRRTGTRMDVRVTSLRMQNLAPLANALSIMKNNGWLTDEDALRKFDVKNPERYLRQITIEQAKMQSPEFQDALLEHALKEEKSPLYDLYMKNKRMSAFKPTPGSSSPPLGDMPSPPAPGAATGMQSPGLSGPAFGVMPGTQGGRPPGSFSAAPPNELAPVGPAGPR